MTDEELAEIEEWFRLGTMYGFSRQGSVEAAGKAHSLIAEVRRLKKIVGYIESEHARATGLHTDGTAMYSLRGIVGEGTSIEDAVSRKCQL